MVKKRLIPCLDVAGGRVVGVNLQANPDKLLRVRLPGTRDAAERWHLPPADPSASP